MWHEARKQERKIRGIMVNYKKRAERRRAFYEKMKADPMTFLRIQGTNYKIHIDHQNTLSDDHINMMPWQGDRSVMIDRFDVRAHLDYIPPYSTAALSSSTLESSPEEQNFNYERYRTLVMIEASGVSEEVYLKQLELEEQNPRTGFETMEKKEKPAPKASIGYTYQNSTVVMGDDGSESSEIESDSDLDIDVAVNVDELETDQKNELNQLAIKFNIIPGKYCSMLKTDKDEAELVQKVKDEEEARGQLRGRRAKRDRRSLKDQQRKFRSNSPLSYMRRESPSYEPYQGSRSSSSVSSAGEPSKVEYITEFGAAADTKASAPSLPSGDTNSRVQVTQSLRENLGPINNRNVLGQDQGLANGLDTRGLTTVARIDHGIARHVIATEQSLVHTLDPGEDTGRILTTEVGLDLVQEKIIRGTPGTTPEEKPLKITRKTKGKSHWKAFQKLLEPRRIKQLYLQINPN